MHAIGADMLETSSFHQNNEVCAENNNLCQQQKLQLKWRFLGHVQGSSHIHNRYERIEA